MLMKSVTVIPTHMFILGKIHGKEDEEFCMSGVSLYMHRDSHIIRALYFCLFLGLGTNFPAVNDHRDL